MFFAYFLHSFIGEVKTFCVDLSNKFGCTVMQVISDLFGVCCGHMVGLVVVGAFLLNFSLDFPRGPKYMVFVLPVFS